MKNSILFIILLVVVIAGGVGLFYFESRLPNNEIVNRDVISQLLKVDALDANINELVLRSRANLDANYDMLVRSTIALERTVSGLSSSYFKKDSIAGSLLDTRFERFKSAVEIKIDQVESFKSSNSVLRNSEKYIPLVGLQLTEQAKQSDLLEVGSLYKQVVIETLEFTRQGSNKPKEDLAGFRERVLETESVMPSDSSIKILEYANHIATVIDSKHKTDQYLSKVLSSATDDQIGEISNAWGLWQSDNSNSRESFRYLTIAYLMTILALVGLLVYRLRRLYANLDKEVEEKAQEAKRTYEDLQVSERQLAQSERMASLGQLVAGVAHEINTPLGYISSNMDTIKARLGRLAPIFHKASSISETLSDPSQDRSSINKLLKEQILAYRKVGKNNTPENIDTLISDASEGLHEIKDIVDSLTNFSHVQDVPAENVDVNERLKSTLKMSASTLGKRKIVTRLQEDLPSVSGVPNQLVQVFNNVINNAAHATDAAAGVIVVESKLVGDSIEIYFQDNGKGIDDESLTRVFEPFFTTKGVGEGTGLGLSISHRIVEAHDGKLLIESTVEVGTKVTVRLPRAV